MTVASGPSRDSSVTKSGTTARAAIVGVALTPTCAAVGTVEPSAYLPGSAVTVSPGCAAASAAASVLYAVASVVPSAVASLPFTAST